jgi:hypothetical protein
MEAGQAGGPKRSRLRRIPSFEACVELPEDLPAGKSRHGNAAAQVPKDAQATQQQPVQQQRKEQGGTSSTQATADLQPLQQQQQAAVSAESMHCPSSPSHGKSVPDEPHFSVIVMPDGQHLALAIPEIDAAQDANGNVGSSASGAGPAGASANAQQPQQLAQSRLRRAGGALLRAVMYLFVQPVPNARDFEQIYVAGNQQVGNRTALL